MEKESGERIHIYYSHRSRSAYERSDQMGRSSSAWLLLRNVRRENSRVKRERERETRIATAIECQPRAGYRVTLNSQRKRRVEAIESSSRSNKKHKQMRRRCASIKIFSIRKTYIIRISSNLFHYFPRNMSINFENENISHSVDVKGKKWEEFCED